VVVIQYTRCHSIKLYYPDARVTAHQFFSLFVLSKYEINCQKKRYQPAVSELIIASKCFFVYVSLSAVVSAL